MDLSSITRDARSSVPASVVASKINWCSGADDWGDSDVQFATPVVGGGAATSGAENEDMENANDEPNGNVMEKIDNR